MDLKRVNILLERYWNCVSSVEEEEELKAFFERNDVPEDMMNVAKLFRYYSKQRIPGIKQQDFDSSILAKLKHNKSPASRSIETTFQNYMKVAAVLLMVLAASLVFRMEVWKTGNAPNLLFVEDTYQTPEEAFAETKRAFLLIASKMNEGREQADRIKAFSEAEQKIKTPKK